ncbi:Carcinine transporter [Eumeta japonica]|uniref:Carcinine transporter n=1 Tax=Eumeta variegata TaxID=151549 RepID=A0A4C1TXE6_EUMVA|nr:Carcinine transporter [Eumeta japonica]
MVVVNKLSDMVLNDISRNNTAKTIENNDESAIRSNIESVSGNSNRNDGLNANEEEEMDFDDLLPLAGEFGRYQLFLFALTLPFYSYAALVYFVQLFMTEVPSGHWCWIPELANLTEIERRTLAIPPEDNGITGYSRCSSYVANWTQVLSTGIKPDKNWEISPCRHGWEFNRTEIPYPTAGTDFEWVCEKDSYQATAQAIFFAGSVLGGFIIGWIADRFGRLPGAVISCLIGAIGGVISIFTRNFGEFAASRFFMGMSYDNCMMMMYIIVLEYVAPKYRTMMANLSFALFFTLGACSLPWIALICANWKILSLTISIYLALALFAPLVVPESPKWLLSKGRVEDAIKKLLSICRINKKEISPKTIEKFRASAFKAINKQEKVNGLEILKRPLVRKVFLLVCLEYVCCCIIFDALVRSVGQLGVNIFVSFTAISFTEFPSLVIVAFIMDWMGRRWMSSVFLSICCLFSFLTAFVSTGLPSVLCAVLARFSVNIAYNATIQWAAEMLPTGVRAFGVSAVHICGYIATLISPYIVYLNNVVPWLPLVIVACVAIVGGVTALILPETAKRDLPQTFDDAEELIKNQSFWEIPCINKKKERKHVEGYYNENFEN